MQMRNEAQQRFVLRHYVLAVPTDQLSLTTYAQNQVEAKKNIPL